jgi:hypothetical protein
MGKRAGTRAKGDARKSAAYSRNWCVGRGPPDFPHGDTSMEVSQPQRLIPLAKHPNVDEAHDRTFLTLRGIPAYFFSGCDMVMASLRMALYLGGRARQIVR